MNTGTRFKIKDMSPQLLVADIEQSIEFYKGKLEFDLAFRYEDFYAGITRDGYSIHLKAEETNKPARDYRKNNEHCDLVFSIDGIEELYKDFLNKGVAIIQPLREMPYGKEFYIADPDGYVMAFIEEKNEKMI